MTVGSLEIAGGAAELLRGEFETTNEALLPGIGYEEDEDEGEGELEIAMPTAVGESDDDDSEWCVALNSKVTRSLDVDVGIGEVEIDLAGLSLEETNVEVGTGELQVVFSEREPRVSNARFKVGVGEAHVRIPAGAGARVKVEVGLGEVTAEGFTETEDGWVSDWWRLSEAGQNVDLSVRMGVGNVSLELVPEESGSGDADSGAAVVDEEDDD